MSDKKLWLGRRIISGVLALTAILMGLQSFAVIPRSEASWNLTMLLLVFVTGIQMCWGAKAKWEKAAGIACFVAALMLVITVARGFGRGI